MEKSVVRSGDGSSETRLGGSLGLLVEKKERLLQKIFCKRYRLYPARIMEVPRIRGEVEVRLESPTIVSLQLIK